MDVIADIFGTKRYYIDNKLHRENGPAVEYADGCKVWFIKNKRHRVDGPAFEDSNGNKRWYLDNKEYSFEEWDRLRKMLWIL